MVQQRYHFAYANAHSNPQTGYHTSSSPCPRLVVNLHGFADTQSTYSGPRSTRYFGQSITGGVVNARRWYPFPVSVTHESTSSLATEAPDGAAASTADDTHDNKQMSTTEWLELPLDLPKLPRRPPVEWDTDSVDLEALAQVKVRVHQQMVTEIGADYRPEQKQYDIRDFFRSEAENLSREARRASAKRMSKLAQGAEF